MEENEASNVLRIYAKRSEGYKEFRTRDEIIDLSELIQRINEVEDGSKIGFFYKDCREFYGPKLLKEKLKEIFGREKVKSRFEEYRVGKGEITHTKVLIDSSKGNAFIEYFN